MRTTLWEIFLNGWRSSQIIQRTQKCQHPQTLLMTQIRDVLRKWQPGSMVVTLTSQKTEIAKSACEPKCQGLFAENALAKQYLEQEKFGDLISADHKLSNEGGESRNNHRYAFVVQDWATQWIQSYPWKTKTSQESEKGFYESSSNRQKSRKSFFLDTSLEFWQILWTLVMESLYFNTPSIRDEWPSWKTGAQNSERPVKAPSIWWRNCRTSCTSSEWRDACCIVAIRIGWKMVGWFYGMPLLSARCPRLPGGWENTFRTAIWRMMGKHFPNGDLENHFKDQSFRLVHWLSISLFLRKTSQESINLARKSYLDCSLDTLCTRRIWKGDLFGRRHSGAGQFWRVRNPCSRAQWKGSNNVKKLWKILSQSQMEQQNCLEETMEFENPLRAGTNSKGVKISQETFGEMRRSLNR